MAFSEEAQRLSAQVSQEKQVEACLLFFNRINGVNCHYEALIAIGIDAETAELMDRIFIIKLWRLDLIQKSVIRKTNREMGCSEVETAN